MKRVYSESRYRDPRASALMALVRLVLIACCVGAVLSPVDFGLACFLAAFFAFFFLLSFF